MCTPALNRTTAVRPMALARRRNHLGKSVPSGMLALELAIVGSGSVVARNNGTSSLSRNPFALAGKRNVSIRGLDSMRDGRERVVVLGSGWAGYTVARRLDPTKYQAVVVSPRSYFVFTPLLASTAVGTLEFRTALEPIRSKRTRVEFFQGWADSVNFKAKTVAIEEAVDDPRQGYALTADRNESSPEGAVEAKKGKGELYDMKWDKLVIAVGCYSETFGTPGVKEHALFLKDVGDARKIRKRILACFETAALPTTTEKMKQQLLNFAIIGGGPTGIEFSAELHDIIKEDLSVIYPDLMPYVNISVYDVASRVLSMFDENLSKYAMDTFRREGIKIKTSHHVQELRTGPPTALENDPDMKDKTISYTLKVKEEGEVGVGMVVWSTGLMMNPFVSRALRGDGPLPAGDVELQKLDGADPKNVKWSVKKHPRVGSIVTNDRLQVIFEGEGEGENKPRAIAKDVYALGDCATLETAMYPATAQVANQKAEWLAKRLNRGDIESDSFSWKNMGVMAYIGNWRAVMQSNAGKVSGRAAWLVWRGAYLTKSVSLRNKILIPIYWFVNWVFGRDISRF